MSEPETNPDPIPQAEPAKKKKRGKKGGAAAAAAPAPLPGEGTPDGTLLREANAAFEAGNYAKVRELTTQLRSPGKGDPAIVDAAADLARRVAVDPVQIGFLAACLLAIVTIFYIYVIR